MWKLIRKWWFLRKFDEAITRHTLKSSLEDISSGQIVLVTQRFFIVGNEEYPGLAKESLKRFSKILWWRKIIDTEILKKRINEYNEIFHVCTKEGYIGTEQTSQGPMPARGKFFYDIYGWAGLVQLLAKKFTAVWGILGTIIGFFLGLYLKS